MIKRAGELGEKIKTRILEGAKDIDIIGDVRGHGLFLGIELIKNQETLEPDEATAEYIVNELRIKHKILLSTDGPFHNVLKFKPPLCFTLENANQLLNALEKVLQRL